jgi:hypothetical protein
MRFLHLLNVIQKFCSKDVVRFNKKNSRTGTELEKNTLCPSVGDFCCVNRKNKMSCLIKM